jgi:predicted transcriptional regulator
MSKEITKDDLKQEVLDQIKLDIDCGEYEALETLLEFCSMESLIAYLPESVWKKYKHLIQQ